MLKRFVALTLIMVLALTNVYADETIGEFREPYDKSQVVKEYRSLPLEVKDLKPLASGYPNYTDFIGQYDFSDVTAYNKKAATELASLGIARGIGRNLFGSQSEIKNIEALIMFIRMFGRDEAVKAEVRKDNPGIDEEKLRLSYYDAIVEEARNNGLLEREEGLPYFRNATREDIAYWFMKAATLVNTEPRNLVETASDMGEIRADRMEAVATLLDLDIMTLGENSSFGPKNPMRRQDFARLLSNTLSHFSDKLKVKKETGLVVGFKKDEGPEGKFSDIVMKNANNELLSIRTGLDKEGRNLGFPLLGTTLRGPEAIVKGMELEFLIRDGRVILARELYANEIKSEIVMALSKDTEVEILQGEVLSNLEEEVKTDKSKIKMRRLRLELDNDKAVDFVEEEDLLRGLDQKLIVKQGPSFINMKDLPKGSIVTAYVKGDRVLFLQVGRENLELHKGWFRSFTNTEEGSFITILTNENKLLKLTVGPTTSFSTNRYRVEAKDLKAGAPVTVLVLRGVAEYVKSESYQPPEGYIVKNGKILFATVVQVQPKAMELRGEVNYCELGPGTKLLKDGRLIELSSVKPGDKLKLYYDDIYTKVPAKIVVEKYGARIHSLLKADVSSYSKARQTLTLSEPRQMKSQVWTPLKEDYMPDYKLARDVEIFDGERKIEAEELGGEILARPAYLVVRDNINSKEVAKLVFTTGFERSYFDEVDDYDNSFNRMKLGGGKTLAYGDESIFIKNDRLVTKDELKSGSYLDIVANSYNGLDKALVLNLLSVNEDILKRLIVATVENVNPYNLDIKNYATIGHMKFNKVDEGLKKLEFSNDVSLFDATKEKFLTREEFFNGDYYRKENKDKKNKGLKHKRYYGVFVTDGGDRLLAARIRHKGFREEELLDDKLKREGQIPGEIQNRLSKMTFTKGSIASFDAKWKRLALYDVYSYFDFHKEWRPSTASESMGLKNAIIIKDNKIIDYNELRLDQDVFAIRLDDEAMILIVE